MPASMQDISGTSGKPRFHNMRTRALSDEYGRHTRPASAGVSCMIGCIANRGWWSCVTHTHMLTVCWLMQELPRAPSLRDSVRTSSLQTPSAPAAAEPPPASFAISLAGEGMPICQPLPESP